MNVVSLGALCDELLASAHAEPGGRAARTLHGDCSLSMRQMAVALVAGRETDQQGSGSATVQILRGRVRINERIDEHIDEQRTTTELAEGDLAAVPGAAHRVTSLEDSVVLLSVDLRS